jgi:tetratricopeptide (TPR) repeat protein
VEAALAFERKQYSQADALLRQAAGILTTSLLPNHPELGKVMARLADVSHRRGHLEESQDQYKQALAILEEAWGPESPQLLSTLEAYSRVLRARQEYAAAASADARAMKIRVTRTLSKSS